MFRQSFRLVNESSWFLQLSARQESVLESTGTQLWNDWATRQNTNIFILFPLHSLPLIPLFTAFPRYALSDFFIYTTLETFKYSLDFS